MDFHFNYSHTDWQVGPDEHHPFMEDIRKAILKYRLQSASHFGTVIDVAQAIHSSNPDKLTDITPSFLVRVGFYNFGSAPLFAACRPRFRKRSRKNTYGVANAIEVLHNNKVTPLHIFLGTTFPILDTAVDSDVMYKWWSENDKKFKWAGLPTELKEQVVQSCMRKAFDKPNVVSLRHRVKKGARAGRGLTEIVRQLGKWASLLGVSRQVRAITLRLCFVGSSDLIGSAGLCLDTSTYRIFEDRMRYLGKYYQMTESDGVPTDAKTQALADTYKQYPKLYPELKQYATFAQGIRKIRVQMRFLEYFHFFKTTARGFKQYWKPRGLDYEVLERLPHLNELVIVLPDPRVRLRDSIGQSGPRLFHDEPFACPRILHRLIYEQAAEVLAPYNNVTMVGFMDGLEAARFTALRDNAIRALKFTGAELEKLYMEDGGGVQLEESVIPGVQVKDDTECQAEDVQAIAKVQDDFWPPKCRCEVLCRKILHPDTI